MAENETPTLRESIEKAAEEQNTASDNVSDTNKSDTTSNDSEQESVSEEKKDDSFKPDPEIEEAVNFYQALKDPKQQREIIAELAKRAGLIEPGKEATKTEEKKYTQLIEEILGEDYPDLKGRLEKVFQAFESESDKKLAALQYQIQQDKSAAMAQEFDKEFSAFLRDNKISDEMAGRMIKEIETLPPAVGKNGKRISLTDYLTKIHSLVSTENRVQTQTVERVEKINKNLNARVTNMASDIGEDRLKRGSRLPTIRESVQAAAQGIKFDDD